ncbi:Hemolysin-type calcium-binding repeat-containing protein [Geodermatophilus siccatus]|uniref:Hemolysin-type calcium-binding repeat-containing protein n=1 Tax=Geodermatophilus siccatus TaxID=1137991 RepID=A0A1G9VN35_9ACTN|nr:endonuclease/exonuclease/phosphatase family protein [Geodermatophilus siccatus]SDM73614.1 Hemolysin-type calcium-binding repeat-containing protein [Geodermatophilus siccatus]
MRIGTWDLENLLRPEDEAGPGDPAGYGAEPAALAEVVVRTAPDVLAVQEVGNPDALADVAERAGGAWHCVTAGVEPSQRPIRVGFLSRPPLTDVAEVTGSPPERAADRSAHLPSEVRAAGLSARPGDGHRRGSTGPTGRGLDRYSDCHRSVAMTSISGLQCKDLRRLFRMALVGVAALLVVFLTTSPAAAQVQDPQCAPATITGTGGNDTITISIVTSNSRIDGLDGNDTIYDLGSGNQVCGSAGNDTIWGNESNNGFRGGMGNDTLIGESQIDFLNGGPGNDTLFGGTFGDVLIGDQGNDTIHGQQDSDTIFGDANNDTLHGGPGNDLIDGGPGNDTCVGGPGADTFEECEVVQQD